MTVKPFHPIEPVKVAGNLVSAVILVILFTGIFNLANVNWIAFAVLFVILFITLDVFLFPLKAKQITKTSCNRLQELSYNFLLNK